MSHGTNVKQQKSSYFPEHFIPLDCQHKFGSVFFVCFPELVLCIFCKHFLNNKTCIDIYANII